MGIVSSSRKVHFDEIMRSANIKHYFDFFVVGEDIHESRHKPHPDQYLKALKMTGIRPEEGLAIEDSERGVIAAKAAGLTCFAVPTVLSRGGDFSKADKVLKNIRELIPLILGSA